MAQDGLEQPARLGDVPAGQRSPVVEVGAQLPANRPAVLLMLACGLESLDAILAVPC